MIILYWNIGKIINENSVWKNKFLKKLSFEIKNGFLSAKGFAFVGNQYHLEVEKKIFILIYYYIILSQSVTLLWK